MSKSISMQIEIPTDNDGYILLQCPLCGNHFKITPKDYNDESILHLYCPSCGLNSNNYLTQDVIDLALTMSKNVAIDMIEQEMKKLRQSLKKSSITIKNSSKINKEYESPIYATIDALTITSYECCHKKAKIKPLLRICGSYCPFCGVKNLEMSKNDLKKIISEFNSRASRLMSVHYEEYNNTLEIFLKYIDNTPLISTYIKSCGDPTYDIEEAVKEVSNSYGRSIFQLGTNDKEEITNIYHILKYAIENEINIMYLFGNSYTTSNRYQDMANGFNQRVVLVLINHIGEYLTKIGIDMGMDENSNYKIENYKGQVNVATGNASINATQNNNVNLDELKSLLEVVKKASAQSNLDKNDTEIVSESIATIEQELSQPQPKRKILSMVFTGLRAVKGSAEFGAALTALYSFVQPLLM